MLFGFVYVYWTFKDIISVGKSRVTTFTNNCCCRNWNLFRLLCFSKWYRIKSASHQKRGIFIDNWQTRLWFPFQAFNSKLLTAHHSFSSASIWKIISEEFNCCHLLILLLRKETQFNFIDSLFLFFSLTRKRKSLLFSWLFYTKLYICLACCSRP